MVFRASWIGSSRHSLANRSPRWWQSQLQLKRPFLHAVAAANFHALALTKNTVTNRRSCARRALLRAAIQNATGRAPLRNAKRLVLPDARRLSVRLGAKASTLKAAT